MAFVLLGQEFRPRIQTYYDPKLTKFVSLPHKSVKIGTLNEICREIWHELIAICTKIEQTNAKKRHFRQKRKSWHDTCNNISVDKKIV